MTKLKCSLACCDYDRTRAIFDGRVAIEGCDVTTVALEPEESFVRARQQEFDITEQSFSTHAMLTAKGENPYVGIPVFVSRVFRHSGIYIRTDRGINGPPDLRGKTIGLPEYAMTASVWIRGMLQDDYGVKPADVRWRQGATDHPLPPLPGQIELQHIPHGNNLSDMLAAGEIDAIIGARQPACFTQRHEKVARLFPNYREAERDYYRRTRIFPDDACHRYSAFACRGPSMVARKRVQGICRGQASLHDRTGTDRLSLYDLTVVGRRVGGHDRTYGRGLLALRCEAQPPNDRDLRALSSRARAFTGTIVSKGSFRVGNAGTRLGKLHRGNAAMRPPKPAASSKCSRCESW